MEISIITAVRNGARTIQNCLTAVRCQTVPAEHIVIDACSTDGTLDLLAAEKNPLLKFVSESDQGLYDAMNKGIALAKGDIIGILNCDDFYAHAQALERVLEVFNQAGGQSCYGDLLYVRAPERNGSARNGRIEVSEGVFRLHGERKVRFWCAGPISPRAFYWGWMPPHPAFFVRRSVYERIGKYRLDFGTAADYEFMLRALVKNGISTRYIPEVLVKMLAGGLSNVSLANRWKANRYDRQAWSMNDLRPYPWTLFLKPARKLSQWARAGASESPI
jgi:glycosyltransferase involved in cell wall biosynthesis